MAELLARRSTAVERRKRQAPPSRHATSEPSAVSQPESPTVVAATPPEKLPAAAVTAPAKAAPVRPAQAPAKKRSRPTTKPAPGDASGDKTLRLGQFYIDAELDDWLRKDVRAAALMRDLDVSGSAVVREALRRLREQLTGEQVVDLLGTGRTTAARGRPRR